MGAQRGVWRDPSNVKHQLNCTFGGERGAVERGDVDGC